MNRFCRLAAVAVILAGGLPPAGAQEKVLVPGDPPLTQGLADSYTEFLSYLLGIKLDADESKTFQALVVADWKGWDKTARDGFVQQLAEWHKVSKKGGKFDYRAKLLPHFLDRQDDPKKLSASERWMLESYQFVYKKLAAERPIAPLEKQPAAQTALPGKYGFPADPKHPHIFPKAVVFAQAQLFSRNWGVDFYVDPKTGQTHMSYQYWWFFPTGRFYMRGIRCLGSEPVKGKEMDLLVRWYYLASTQVDDSWGRYTIDDKDRLRMETDKGEKITMHLTYGRQQANWGGTVYDAPPKKKS